MATIVAASCSYEDVAASIAAAFAGDTVRVPEGSDTWSSQLVVDKPLSVIAAGKTKTLITGNTGGLQLFKYAPGTNITTAFRLSGFGCDCNNNCGCLHLVNSGNQYPNTNIRVDNNSFTNVLSPTGTAYNGAVRNEGQNYGVIDNNIFEGNVIFRLYGLSACDEWGYHAPATPGTLNCLFVETNTITTDTTINSGGQGSRVCYRYNTIHYTNVGTTWAPAFDTHGNQTAGVTGTILFEVYKNILTSDNANQARIVGLRGGVCIIWGNETTLTSIYPDWCITNEHCNAVTCSGIYEFQIKNSYLWNNYHNDSLIYEGSTNPPYDGYYVINASEITNNCAGEAIAKDANVWLHTSGFDGATGMGVGVLASRPSATGLSDGIGYWATDTQTFYRVANETWETYYTPYTYPHPLRGLGSSSKLVMVLK